MKASELKKSLHEKIELVDDIDLLYALNVIISKQTKVYNIPTEHLEGLKEAEQDIEAGEFYTLEDFEEKYNQWLKD